MSYVNLYSERKKIKKGLSNVSVRRTLTSGCHPDRQDRPGHLDHPGLQSRRRRHDGPQSS